MRVLFEGPISQEAINKLIAYLNLEIDAFPRKSQLVLLVYLAGQTKSQGEPSYEWDSTARPLLSGMLSSTPTMYRGALFEQVGMPGFDDERE